MTRRIAGWTLRVFAWAMVLIPLVRTVSSPRRSWFDGRFSQLCVAWQSDDAQKELLDDLGVSAVFQTYDLEIIPPSTLDEEFVLNGKREFWVFGRDRNKDAHLNSIVYLTSDAHALLPPFWRGSFSQTFMLNQVGGAGLFAGIEIENGDHSSRIGNCESASEWRVWFWENNRWTCALRVNLTTEHFVRFEFEPSRERVRSIICHVQQPDSDDEIILARFAWNSHDRTLTVSSEPAFDFSMPDPLPPITIDDPFPKSKQEAEEDDVEILEYPPPATSSPAPW